MAARQRSTRAPGREPGAGYAAEALPETTARARKDSELARKVDFFRGYHNLEKGELLGFL